MKALCLVILLAIAVPGCSRYSKANRTERAYYKQLNKARVAREKQRNRIQRQRSEMRSLREPPPPPLQRTVEPSENQ